MTKEAFSEIKEILCSDPGVDDALAILVSWEALTKPAIIATYGNSSTGQTSRNLNALHQFHQQNVKNSNDNPLVFTGIADRPLDALLPFETNVEFIHGKFAMEGAGKWVRPINDKADTLYEALEKCPQKPLDLFSFGAVTEILHILNRKSRLAKNIRSITLMGGAINQHGNTDMHQEANFRLDPPALTDILVMAEKRHIPITIVPRDVTEEPELELTPDRVNSLAQNLRRRDSHHLSAYLLKLLGADSTYSRFYRSRSDIYDFRPRTPVRKRYQGPPIHDLTALYAQTNPELFTFETFPIKVGSDGVIGIGRKHYGITSEVRVATNLADGASEKYWQITEDHLANHYN